MTEKDSRVKSSSFYTIHGWMINDLGLKGTQLSIYAIIHGFSQDGAGCFNGSLRYLMDWTGCTKQTVLTALKSLVDDDLLIKNEQFENGVKLVNYQANGLERWSKNKTAPSLKNRPTQSKNKTAPGLKIRPNNIDNNIEDNIDNNIIAQSGKSAAEPENIIFSIPCTKGEEYHITSGQIAEWSDAYPRVDIELSIRQMIAWCNSNPSKRKTLRGCPRFVTSWLARNQDSGRTERAAVYDNPQDDIGYLFGG